MKLIDLLSITNESQTVIVVENGNEEIARYDGKDSIPMELNDRVVITQYVLNGNIVIEVEVSL